MKIKIGKEKNPRRPFDLSFDNSTTAEWGFMQPTCFIHAVPDSTINVRPNTFVRLNPLVAPTFGRCVLKHYAYFVPIRDVMMSFENMMSGTIYGSGNSSYIPSSMPKIYMSTLTSILLSAGYSQFSVYSANVNGSNYTNITASTPNNAHLTEWETTFKMETYQGGFNITTQFVNGLVSIDGADFILTHVGSSSSERYIYCFRLTNQGKRLRKILIGLGYQPNLDNHLYVNFLPLLAYYKAWFDLFAVKRTHNWESTNAYRYSRELVDRAIITIEQQDSQRKASLRNFINDLTECYYVCNPDYFTAHQSTMNFSMTNGSMNLVNGFDGSSERLTTVIQKPDTTTIYDDNSSSSLGTQLSALSIKAALKWLPFVNKNTAIGQKISAYFGAHGLGSTDDNKDSGFVGACSVNVDVSDVMSNAATSDAGLGDYAGKGVGASNGQNLKYDAACYGYYIILTCVVPRAGYVQGLDSNLTRLGRFDVYTPEFDALGMEVSPKAFYNGSSDLAFTSGDVMGKYGVIPRYSSYKQHQNIANGDITLRSFRKNMLPFMLDRWMTVADLVTSGAGTNAIYKSAPVPQVNDELRYLGKNEFFGNFNRIFALSPNAESYELLADNFIVHNSFDIKVIAPMKPMSESWDTDEYEHTMSIEKA